MDEVTVTQADREAAANLIGRIGLSWSGDMIRAGKSDDHDYVQAFAHHRHQAEREARVEWKGIESPPKDGTKAVLFFPQDATDFDGVDYSLRLAIYRQNETFRHGTWCDQGTNHDSFEGPDMSGDDRASHYLTLPPAPEAKP